jgi:16S rRNA (guanine527-N7)-methyltransferase
VSTRELRERIRRRARKEEAALLPSVAEGLERYYVLLAKWNARVNLTAFRLLPEGDDDAVDRLLIEPLLAARHLPATVKAIMDVGSGGGSPAIPFKLAAPDCPSLRMVEAKVRKAVFLRHAVRELGLTDVVVEASRYEELLARPELHEAVDTMTVRAVRVEARTLVTLQAFLKPGGQIFLFRGPGGVDLADSLTPPLSWTATYPLLASRRSRLVVLTKTPVGRARLSADI